MKTRNRVEKTIDNKGMVNKLESLENKYGGDTSWANYQNYLTLEK